MDVMRDCGGIGERMQHAHVWQLVRERHRAFHDAHAASVHPRYYAGLAQLRLTDERPPTAGELDAVLAQAGWKVREVPGYIPVREYIALVAKREFPVSRDVRSIESIDHAPAPDLIHDVLGHLPWLFWNEYSEFIVDLARAMLERDAGGFAPPASTAESQGYPDGAAADGGPAVFQGLSRLSLWSTEFGVLVNPAGGIWLVGAGLMSAPGEASAVIDGRIRLKAFGDDVFTTDIKFSEQQDAFFLAQGMHEYRAALAAYLAADATAPRAAYLEAA